MHSKLQLYDPETKIWSGLPKTPDFDPSLSFAKIIIQSLVEHSDEVSQIFVDNGSQKTFGDIHIDSIKVAENLKKIGITLGDVVCISSKNNPDIAAVFFGCAFIGASISCLDSSLRKDDLRHMFSIVKPKLLICERSNVEYVEAALKENNFKADILVFGNTVTNILLQPVEIKTENFSPALIPNQLTHSPLIVCSSGTTGPPKGVSISHQQLINHYVNSVPSKGIHLAFSSLHWVSGLFSLIGGTTMGTTRLITMQPFTAELSIEIFQKYKITSAFLLPLQIAAILDCPNVKSVDFSSLKVVQCAGSIVVEELRANFEKLLPNGNVRVLYGMTEIGGVATSTAIFKPSAAGQIVFNSKIKIVDETGNSLGPNAVGEILIKSPCPFICYLGDLEATKNAFDNDGWYRSGDLGHFDNDSFLFITGRCKEIIKYNNFHISPSELESFLHKETGISQVCVFGVDDFLNGNDLPAAAFVKPPSCGLTVEDIQKIAQDKLPDYKQFRGGIYFLEKLPLTFSGKIKKREIKDIFQKNFAGKNVKGIS